MDPAEPRLRSRIVPAVLTAIGLVLLTSGLMSYTTAVEVPPTARPLASYDPLPTVNTAITLPGGGPIVANPSFPPGRVATRVVIRRLGIDLPVMLQTDDYGIYPLCDVAMFIPQLGQPGQGRATYIYAHARVGMFHPLMVSAEKNDGAAMLGMSVEVYTSDDWHFVYTVHEVRRHILSLDDAFAARTEQVWLQTSEGPNGTVPKLQVIGDFASAEKTDPVAAHPDAHPRICR